MVAESGTVTLGEIDEALEWVVRFVIRVRFGAHVDVSALVVHEVIIISEVGATRFISLSRPGLDERGAVSFHSLQALILCFDGGPFHRFSAGYRLLVFTTDLTFVLHELDTLLIIFLLELLESLFLLEVFLGDVLLKSRLEVAQGLSFTGELGPDDRG